MVEFGKKIKFGRADENILFVLTLRYDYSTRNGK
jgi:hypothetical protein